MDQSGSSDGLKTLDIDPDSMSEYWTVLGSNTSLHAEMVSGSGRIPVMVFGSLLLIWSFCFHIWIIWIQTRRCGRKPGHQPFSWYLISLSADQLGIVVLVLPIELLTEYYGVWPLGGATCRLWRPVHIALMASYFWSHFVITLDACFRRYRRKLVPSLTGSCMHRPAVTCLVLLTSWLASSVSAIVVTVVMRRRAAMFDEVCAMDMSIHVAFALSFAVYVLPVATTAVASGALLFTVCSLDGAAATEPKRMPSGDFLSPAGRLAKASDTGSTTTVDKNCACANLIAADNRDDQLTSELRHSVVVVLTSNGVAALLWLPFYVINLKVPFCSGLCMDPNLWTSFLWLGYASLGIGPVIWMFEPTLGSKVRSGVNA